MYTRYRIRTRDLGVQELSYKNVSCHTGWHDELVRELGSSSDRKLWAAYSSARGYIELTVLMVSHKVQE